MSHKGRTHGSAPTNAFVLLHYFKWAAGLSHKGRTHGSTPTNAFVLLRYFNWAAGLSHEGRTHGSAPTNAFVLLRYFNWTAGLSHEGRTHGSAPTICGLGVDCSENKFPGCFYPQRVPHVTAPPYHVLPISVKTLPA